MSRVMGGGDAGVFLEKTFIADSTFITEITSLISSGTDVVGKRVQIATSADYTVTSPADGAEPDGEIIAYELDDVSTYRLTCQIWGYQNYDSVYTKASVIKNFLYSGTPALGKYIEVSGGTYHDVEATTTLGMGKIIAIDHPSSGYLDVLY